MSRRNKTIKIDPIGSGNGGEIVIVGEGQLMYLNIYSIEEKIVGTLDGYAIKELMLQLTSRLGYEVKEKP